MPLSAKGLSPDQRADFDERGFVRLSSAIPRAAVAAMADRLWRSLEADHGLKRSSPQTWTVERPFHHQAVVASGAFADLGAPAVRAALDDLMGQSRWVEPDRWGQPLVCFPSGQGEWCLPHRIWHLDGPTEPGDHIRIGRVFAILEPLRPRGGGTVVAEGSHRVVQRLARAHGRVLKSSETRKRLKDAYPWFDRLMSADRDPGSRTAYFMDEVTEADGARLRVTEMTGEPGDVWLMHPDILHAPAPNVLATPRLVLTQFVQPKP